MNNKVIKGLKTFLKYIPGFRSGEKINMIIASIYYIADLLFAIYIIIFQDGEGLDITLAILFLPFMIFSFINYMNNI